MPSAYCNAHPASSICSFNPTYDPFPGGGIINPPVVTVNDVPAIIDAPNFPTMSTTPLPWPKQTNTTTLDKSLTAILSGLAILTRQGSIPTAQQPQPQFDPNIYAQLANAQALDNRSGNTLGKVENWVKNNTGVAAIFAGGALLYFMQPSKPRK